MAKILLVEDDKSLREIYGVRLQAEGYTIVSAGDGEEALAMAIKERPDLIVSDVMMPKISGFDMLDILRSTTETKDVKVIMMTALSSEDQRARGESLGADRYLVKSQVGIEDVVRTVHDVLADGVAQPTPALPTYESAVKAEPTTPTPGLVIPSPNPEDNLVVIPETSPLQAAPIAPQPFAPQPAAVPQPIAEPAYQPAPQPAPQPVLQPVAEPALAPAAPQPFPQPQQPVASPAPVFPAAAPIAPAGPQQVTAPQPAFSTPLPAPTAPFSSPAPASLGERIIQPLTNQTQTQAQPFDISSQMNQALDDHATLTQPASAQPVATAVQTPPVAPVQ
jgi:CheY-like chemotaxis protein